MNPKDAINMMDTLFDLAEALNEYSPIENIMEETLEMGLPAPVMLHILRRALPNKDKFTGLNKFGKVLLQRMDAEFAEARAKLVQILEDGKDAETDL